MHNKELGSKIAKDGFLNEDFVINLFNNYKESSISQKWLEIMGYKLNEIESVRAEKIRGTFKADIQVLVSIKLKNNIDIQNIQVKLISHKSAYNQIDKRYVDNYKELWNIPDDIVKLLKYFTGELLPYIDKPKDKRRMFLTEFSEKEEEKIISFFEKNKILILTDILKGRGKFSAEWFLVILKEEGSFKTTLKPINKVLNFYDGDIKISPKGSLNIGKITMQRKGGDAGRKTATMLQFKIDPYLLFSLED